MMNTPTPDEIARHYSAMLDSLMVLNTSQDPVEIQRNIEHLEIMVAYNWWEGYDLAPINAAIAAGKQ